MSNLSIKVRGLTIYLCQCFVYLKAVRICESCLPFSSNDSRGGPYGSGGKFSPVFLSLDVSGELLIRLIM